METDIRYRRPAMAAETFGDNIRFFRSVALDQVCSCQPVDSVFTGKDICRMRAAGSAAALAAMTEMELLERTCNLVLHAATEAGALYRIAHSISSLLLACNQSGNNVFEMLLVHIGVGETDELFLVLTKVTARQADNFVIFN